MTQKRYCSCASVLLCACNCDCIIMCASLLACACNRDIVLLWACASFLILWMCGCAREGSDACVACVCSCNCLKVKNIIKYSLLFSPCFLQQWYAQLRGGNGGVIHMNNSQEFMEKVSVLFL